MRMRDVLQKKGQEVFSVEPGTTLRTAMRELVDRNVGSLMVLDAGEVVGIITERDLLRHAAEAPERLTESTVQDAMTRDLVTAEPDTDLRSVMDLMTRHRIRHLPVLEGGRLAGIVSIGDVVLACLESVEFENQQMHRYIHGLS